MHRGTWEYAVQQLQKELKTATSKQIALGKSVGLVIDASTPFGVAAAMLRAALAEHLELTDIWPLSDRHKARLKDLRKLTNFLKRGAFQGGSLWTISLEMCSIVGELTPIGIDGGSPMSTITQRIASTLSSSAADTATLPRWRTTESNRGNRFTARLVKSPMLSTEPQSSPASTNSSGNSPGSRLKSKISRSDWSTPSRSHATNRTSSPASPKPRGSA